MGAFDDLLPPSTGGAFDDLLPQKQEKPVTRERSWAQVAGDTGLDLAKGIVVLGESAVGIADLATGNLAGKGLGLIGYDPAQTKELISSGYSDHRQQANRNVSDAKGFWNTAGALIDNPSVIAGGVAESAPMMLGSVGAVRALAGKMLAARGLTAGSAEAGAFLSSPAVVAKLTLAGSATEGAMTAGSIQEQGRQAGRDYTDTAPYALAGGALTAAIGLGTSKIPGFRDAEVGMATAGMGGVQRQGLLAAGKEITKGTFKEGVLEEMPQSAQEQVFTNLALGKPWAEGVPEAAAQGMVVGAAQGGGMNVYSAGRNALAESPANPANPATPATPATPPTNPPPAPASAGQAATNSVAPAPDTSAAEKALRTPVALTALDRVNEIDQSTAALSARADELNRPDGGYGPMFDQERAELATQKQDLATERAELAKDWPKSVSGLASSFATEAGARVEAQYALMDAADLITSHDEGLRKNPLYPPELQPRERDRAASEMQVSGIVQKLDPARLGLSADAANGAPIVGADGLVESGNARTIALKRVYQAGGQKSEDYKQFLRDNASQFGIPPGAIDGMAKPVLVRVRSTPVNRAEFARQANASTVAAMAPSEQAKSDSNRIDSMEDLAPDDSGDFSNAASRPFVRRFMARLPITEQAGMIDANGDLSTTGYARVRNAVLAKAYGDSPVLARMTESMDDNLRNVSKAMMMAAPKVAQMRGAVSAGNRFDADITPDLMAAVEELSRLKDDGGSVQDALAQVDLMGDQRSPEAGQLLQFLSDNMRRPRKMADFIGAYMDALDAAGDPNQGSLLGDTQSPTKQDLLKAAERATTNDNETPNPGTTTQEATPRTGSQTGQKPGDAPGSGRSAEGHGADTGAASQGSAGQTIWDVKAEKPAPKPKPKAEAAPARGDGAATAGVPDAGADIATLRTQALSIARTGAFAKQGITFVEFNGATSIMFGGQEVGAFEGKRNRQVVVDAIQAAIAGPVLAAPTKSDIEAQQDRTEQADKLDQREQVKRESEVGDSSFMTGFSEDGRQDNTGNLFAAPAAEDAKVPSANTIFTEAAAAAARARLKAKLGRLNSGIDPETMMDGITLAGYHIEKGARTFAAFASAMVDDLGDNVRPYLKSWYMGVKYDPRAASFEGMDGAELVEAADVNSVARTKEAENGNLTQTLADAIESGNMPKDNPALKKLVETFDGQPADQARMKQAQEELETAIVIAARTVVAKNDGERSTFDALLRLYESQPNLNIRTSTSIANQAYSTPAPLAFLASRLAGITEKSVAHEPTAGTGMLLIGANPKKAIVNELNDLRITALKLQGFAPSQKDAATQLLVPAGTQPDAIVTNPPFGAVKDADGKTVKVKVDGFNIGQIDHLIAARALETMKADGRATLILGANKVAGGLSTDDRIFFNWLYSHYNVAGHFEVEGDLYTRQGAGWPVRVITINGRQKSTMISPVAGTIQRVDNWSQVYEQFTQSLASATAPRSTTTKPDADQAGGKSPAAVSTPAAPGGKGRSSGTRGAGNVAGAGPRVVPNSAEPVSEPVGTVPDEQRLNAQSHVPQPQPGQGNAPAARPSQPAGNAAVADAEAPKGNEFQAPYTPRSSRKDEGVLIPSNMAQPTQDALNRLEDAVGDIDEFARSELGYDTVADLHNALMGLQVDSVATSIHQIKQGKAVVIADQTGIGKGRQAASIIRWAARQGMTPVFVSVKPSLFTDMYGDLADIGTNDVNPFIMNSSEWIAGDGGEKLFANKPANHKRTIEQIASTGQLPEGSNAVFMTYSQINVANAQRQALMALAPNAVFVLDESHNAAGASATGDFVIGALDAAKGVVYLSATYAKRPDNMPLYFKTDIGDAAADTEGLAIAMASGGLPLQTVVSNNLVKAGQMFRRERSYDGVSIASVFDTANKDLHERMSNEATKALRAIVSADRMFHEIFVKTMAKDLAESGATVQDSAGNQLEAGVQHTEFSSVVHNFVKQMLLGLKAQPAAEKAIDSLKRGEKPIIAVENTMGSFLNEYAAANGIAQGDSLGSFDYRTVLTRALARSRVIIEVKPNGDKVKRAISLNDLDTMTRAAYDDAQAVIDGLTLNIPVSPIDWMRAEIQRAGFSVAEITGRNLSVDYSNPDKPVLSALDQAEQKDKVNTTRQFNSGKLDALILNVAGSTGISLHASEKFEDQRQRHMIVAQAAGDINIFMQMLGRVHRTGQVRLPKYSILSVDLPTEKRPTAVLSVKMKSLNANTSSNTESATSVKSSDILNKYGDQIVNQYLADNRELARALDLEQETVDGAPQDDIARKATGRLALQPIEVQHTFYDEVESQYVALIDYLNKTNQNDLEPRTFDFDAKETRQEVLFEGPNKSTPFGEDAIYGEYSIKAQGTPMKPEEIHAAIAENLAGASASGHTKVMLDELDAKYNAYVSKLDDAGKDSASRVRSMGRSFLNDHKIGDLFRVEINSEPFNAVVLNVRNSHKETSNPYSMSKIQLTVAVNGALRSLSVPATQFKKIEVSAVSTYSKLGQLFKETPPNQRETAKIITGNLLAAYGEIKGVRGTIISFTKQDGTSEQGILLPKLFDYGKNTQGDYRLKDGAAALKFLQNSDNRDIGRFGIASRDGSVRVLPLGQGIRVQVPRSKLKGAKYFLDKGLIAAGGDFVSYSNFMAATVESPSYAVRMLDMLMKKQALYALPSMAEEAKALVGDLGTDGETRLSRSEASSSAGQGMPIETLVALTRRIKGAMPNMPKVNVLASPLDAPKALRDYIEEQGAMNDVDGAMHKGELYLFASGLPNALRAEHVLAEHEAAHFGLRAILGDSLKGAMQAIYNNNAQVRQAATELQRRGRLSNADATEEVIVDIPSSKLVKLTGWRKVVQHVRRWLADHGFNAMAAKLSGWLDGKLTDQQRADLMVANLVHAARAYMAGKRGKRVKVRADTMLSGTLAEDAAKQEQWLSTEARARGFKDIDQLAEKNYPLFEKLAKLWREKNPADMLLSRGNNGGMNKNEGGRSADNSTPGVTLYHGSPETGLTSVHDKTSSLFGGVFASATKDSANSHGENLYKADLPQSSILTQSALDNDIPREDIESALKKAIYRLSDDDIDTAYEAVIDDQSNRVDDDEMMRIFKEDDVGSASWEAQRIRGIVAKQLGFKAVEMSDEHGTSYLLLPGVKLSSPNESTAPDSENMLSRAPLQGTAAERADQIIKTKAATAQPIDALAKGLTRITGVERLTRAIYGRAGYLLDRYTPETIKAGMVSDYGVPEAVIDQRAMMQGRQRVQLRQAGSLIEKLATLTRAESRVAYEWMNETDPHTIYTMMHNLPEESVKVLMEVQGMIDKLSLDAVRMGQLTQEAYDRNKFAYLRRSYVKHTLNQTASEKAGRARAISVLGDQYKGRGLTESATMAQIQNSAPDWWQRKTVKGKADTALKGEKFLRLERRAASGQGTIPLAGMTGKEPGKLKEVHYFPAGEPLPAKYKEWTQAGTFEARDTKGEKVILWRDFTKDEREKMGEIDEARFAIAKTLHAMIHDVEVGRYLEWLAHNYAKKEGETIPGVVVKASERYEDTFKPGEWVKVPDGKIEGTSVLKYGKLAGRYLPGPVWNDLRQTVNGQFKPFGDGYAKILSFWKTSKTALSPAVHMNNVMSNVVMAGWHDVTAGHTAKALRILLGAHSLDGKGALGSAGNLAAKIIGASDRDAAREVLNRYLDSGGNIGSWATNEVANKQIEPLLAAMEAELAATGGQSQQAQIGVMAALQHALMLRLPSAFEALKGSTPGKVVGTEAAALMEMYQNEDEVFRLASWLKSKEEGKTDMEAGKIARRSFMDYSINAPWVSALRNSALPFVSYTYRAVPMMLEIAAKKPHKIMKLMLMAGALNMLGAMLSGGDDDEERKLLPDEKAGRIWGMVPKLIRMPWNDKNASPVYLDIRRFIPVGDVLDVGANHAAVPMLPMMTPGGPLVILGEIVLNKTGFTGNPITLETDTALQQTTKVMDYLYKAFAPNVLGLPGTYASTGVLNAAKGKTDAFGREQSVAQAVASSFGVKLGSYPADVMRKNETGKAQAMMMEIDKGINKLKRQRQTNSITDAEFQSEVQVELGKKRKIQEDLAKKLSQ